jgi:trk system potassium uptake protein TrkA
MEHGALGNILSFAGTSYEAGSVTISAGCIFDGLALREYHEKVSGESMVILVERKGECILPAGSTLLERGDRVHFLSKETEMGRIFHLAGQSEKSIRKIGISGGGRVGILIAEGLLEHKESGLFSFFKNLIPKNNYHVVIIEKDYALCKDLAARFPGALILNEDISDESFVTEERIGDLDLVIAATDQQELNIITAVYLKSRGVARTIAMVTGSGYTAIARQLGVDVVIPIKSAMVDAILSRLMGRGVMGLHSLGDGSINIIEIEVNPGSPAEGSPLKECSLPSGSLVMLVNCGEGSFIPRGDYVMLSGDRVVLITKKGSEAEIRKLFGSAS